MILACPSCFTRYLISAHLFALGPRQVRCARCMHSWQADLPKEIEAVGPPPDADLTPPPDAVTPIPPGSGLPVVQKKLLPPGLLPMLAVGVPAAILALLLLGLFFNRGWLTKTWPKLEPYYEAVGLHVYHYSEGLAFQNVRSELRYDGGKMLLVVEGEIHNTTASTLKIFPIKATAVGMDGKAVQSWQIDPPAAIVAPGNVLKFESSIDAPKDAVTDITLNFIETVNDSNH